MTRGGTIAFRFNRCDIVKKERKKCVVDKADYLKIFLSPLYYIIH